MDPLPPVRIVAGGKQVRNRALVDALEQVGFTRISIAGTTFPGPDTKPRLELVDEVLFRRYFSRTMKDGEIGCYLSHQLAYQALLALPDEWVVIVEDDSEILPGFDDAVRVAASLPTHRPLIIALSPLETGSPLHGFRAPLLRSEPLAMGHTVALHETLFGGWGIVGYVINRRAAELLTQAHTIRPVTSPADWPPITTEISLVQAFPPVICEQEQAISTIGTRYEEDSSLRTGIVSKARTLRICILGYHMMRSEFRHFHGYMRWAYGPARHLVRLPWLRDCGDVIYFRNHEFRFVSDSLVRRRFRWIGLGPRTQEREPERESA